MTINNQNRATWIKFSYYLAVFSFLATMILLLYLEVNNVKLIIGGLLALLILFFVIMALRNFNYVVYKEADEKLIFRFYPLHPFHDNFKAIEIPKLQFKGYEIETKNGKLAIEIILLQETQKGVAKYPPISITGFSKTDREKLLKELNRLKR